MVGTGEANISRYFCILAIKMIVGVQVLAGFFPLLLPSSFLLASLKYKIRVWVGISTVLVLLLASKLLTVTLCCLLTSIPSIIV